MREHGDAGGELSASAYGRKLRALTMIVTCRNACTVLLVMWHAIRSFSCSEGAFQQESAPRRLGRHFGVMSW